MDSNALAAALDIPVARINSLLNERCGITADLAIGLANHFDTTPQFWMAMQNEYDLRLAEMAIPRQAA